MCEYSVHLRTSPGLEASTAPHCAVKHRMRIEARVLPLPDVALYGAPALRVPPSECLPRGVLLSRASPPGTSPDAFHRPEFLPRGREAFHKIGFVPATRMHRRSALQFIFPSLVVFLTSSSYTASSYPILDTSGHNVHGLRRCLEIRSRHDRR